MESSNEYKEDSDVIAKFLREYIHPIDGATGDPDAELPDPTTKQMLTATFQDWKRSNEVSGRATTTDLLKRIESQFGKYPARSGWTSFRFATA
jgi:hypothetical protein